MNDTKNILIVALVSMTSVFAYVAKQQMDTNALLARENLALTEEVLKIRQLS